MPVTIPNLITIGRLFLVPFTVWLIMQGDTVTAFWIFILAGVSDAGLHAAQFQQLADLVQRVDTYAVHLPWTRPFTLEHAHRFVEAVAL